MNPSARKVSGSQALQQSEHTWRSLFLGSFTASCERQRSGRHDGVVHRIMSPRQPMIHCESAYRDAAYLFRAGGGACSGAFQNRPRARLMPGVQWVVESRILVP